jgi:DNA-binding transcriptional LysR family regulator
MQAEVDGQGIVLVDALLVEERQSGLLVAPLNVTLKGYGYYMILHTTATTSSAVQLFADWLKVEALEPF